MLYLSYINFLKHMEGTISEVFAKITQVFEKGIEEGGLQQRERADLAKFYFEYLQENSPTVQIIRNTEQFLKEKGLLYVSKSQEDSND